MRRREFCLASLPLLCARARAATLPRPAPELQINRPGAAPLLLSSFKGRIIALEFLLTTCPHCQKASMLMEKLYKELGGKGFQPLGVAINEGGDPEAYRKQYGLTYPVGTATNQQAIEYLQHPMMARMLMPQLLFIDRNFVIRSQYAGDSPFFAQDEEGNMRKELQKLLQEGSTAPRKAPKKK